MSRIDKDTAVKIAMAQYLFSDVKMLDMMIKAIQDGAEFDEEAECIAVELLDDIRDTCEEIIAV